MNRKKWSTVLFGIYAAWMIWLLFGQRMGQSSDAPYWERLLANLNLRPLATVRSYLWVLQHSASQSQIRFAVINLGGNVIMFVPLGFFVPCIWRKMQEFGWHLLAMVLTILAIELLQLFSLLGSCDVDDLLLNLVGTTVGFGCWKIVECFLLKK